MATFCFDVDGTICTKTKSDYKNAKPIKKMIDMINDLYDQGHKIIFHTARGQTTGIDWEAFTIEQIEGWGVKFHDFYYGKPPADYYVDDKALKISDFILGNY
jgi:uncharacterized HAD superfamily protein